MHSKLLTTILIAAPLIFSSISTAHAIDPLKLVAQVNQLMSQDAGDPPPPPPPPPPKQISSDGLGSQAGTGSSRTTTRL